MKFGLEVEKFLYDLKHNKPSEGVFHFLDAFHDYDPDSERNITNEFVLNMVEIVTDCSDDPSDILKEYVVDYLMFSSVARRESVSMIGMGSLPMDYQPHMAPRWAYFVQNSILSKKIQESWTMSKDSALTPAGNCAGIHIHTEVETTPEYLFSNRELQDKFNLGLMLTPMIAFASSPYFFGEHRAKSMRGQKYFYGVYNDYPLNGDLPPLMHSSEEVLLYFKKAAEEWMREGTSLGLPQEDLEKLLKRKGASWNPIRWNRHWNTIELRCLDSDRLDYDCAKFIWVTGAMKRMDLKGEALRCFPLKGPLSEKMVDEVFRVDHGVVTILSNEGIKELFNRAIEFGLHDPLVVRYLERLGEFAVKGIDTDNMPLFNILKDSLLKKETTADRFLDFCGSKENITSNEAQNLVLGAIEEEIKVIRSFVHHFPSLSAQGMKYLR
jgi:gamma-glutamyl:cysteine ligase YbdK (ATP-grasp superfamily)